MPVKLTSQSIQLCPHSSNVARKHNITIIIDLQNIHLTTLYDSISTHSLVHWAGVVPFSMAAFSAGSPNASQPIG